MTPALEMAHLLMLAFFLAAAYKALTSRVKHRLTTLLVSVLLGLPFYVVLQDNSAHISLPNYPWGAVLPLSVGVIEALRVKRKPRRSN